MKRVGNFAVIFFMGTLLFACKKDENNNSEYGYLTMKVNGQEWRSNNDKNGVDCFIMVQSNAYTLGINGKTDDFNGETSNIEIFMRRTQMFTESSYYVSEDLDSLPEKLEVKIGSKQYFAWAAVTGISPASGSCTANIMAIKDHESGNTFKYINGTFSGTAIAADGSTIEITEGKFHDRRSE